MADIIQLKPSIADSFKSLPESIKDWLGSDLITNYISDINKKLGIKGKKRSIIPRLIVRLVTKDLLPADFIGELAKTLNAPPAAAKAIAQEIFDKTLQPIEIGLRRDTGIDVKTIFFGKPKEAREGGLSPLEALESDTAPAPLTFEEKPAELRPAAPVKTIVETPTLAKGEVGVPTPSQGVGKETSTNGETPVLIYKEGTMGRIPMTKPEISLKPQPVAKTEPEISVKPRLIPPPPTIPARPITPPTLPARNPLTPASSQPSVANEPKATRVVHYSDFFTPLNSFGLDKNPKPTDSAFVDGNVVDLRFI